MKTKIQILVITVFLLFFFPQKVSAAYIDPNTGGMLFQLLATIFGVLTSVILIFSSHIKRFLNKVARNIRESHSTSKRFKNTEKEVD